MGPETVVAPSVKEIVKEKELKIPMGSFQRRPLIAGNWKMHKNKKEAIELAQGLKQNLGQLTNRDIVICPPFTVLDAVGQVIKESNIKLGAQNLYWEEKGAYTGEISPLMLKDSGCEYVIIGHSERRQYFGETNQTVHKKLRSALAQGLIPIVCVGERLAEREKGTTFHIVEQQVKESLGGLSPTEAGMVVIAYEPVWAIGTGKTATPEQAEEVHQFIREIFARLYGGKIAQVTRILYGGSIKPENIASLMKCENIDGGLVGGASLEIDSFTRIVQY